MSIYVNIKKDFGTFKLDVHFETDKNTLALLGASGSGKTMTLKCIAGIIKPDEGRIVINDKVVFDSEKKINLSPQKRNIGYLFQNYALFPNMTVQQNILCGIRKLKLEKEEQLKRAQEVIDLLKLNGLNDRKPHQLSGGEQQRVALARILIGNPELLLLDEPFSALDDHLKTRLQMRTKEIIHKYNIPAILVTHNRDEAYLLADNIGVVDKGRIIVSKKTKDLFENPEYYQAALLTGCKNICEGEKQNSSFKLPKWGIEIKNFKDDCQFIGIRAHSFKEATAKNGYQIEIIDSNQEPFEQLVRFRFINQIEDSEPVYWRLPKDKDVSTVKYISFDKESVLKLK